MNNYLSKGSFHWSMHMVYYNTPRLKWSIFYIQWGYYSKQSHYRTSSLDTRSLMIQFGQPVCFSNASIESSIRPISIDRVFFAYSILPAFCRWSSIHCFSDTSRLFVKRDWRRMPRSSKLFGLDVRAWIRGNENFPSSRSSQNPFCPLYYTQIRQYTKTKIKK